MIDELVELDQLAAKRGVRVADGAPALHQLEGLLEAQRAGPEEVSDDE